MEVNLKPDECKIFSFWNKFLNEHSGMATIDLTKFTGIQDYIQKGLNPTARNVYRKSLRCGFYSSAIDNNKRNFHLSDISGINLSKSERQGRAMSDGYKAPPQAYTGARTCGDHYAQWFGCFNQYGKMVAYLAGDFCGEFSATSQILGHWDYLKDGIMINLWVSFIDYCMRNGIKTASYYLWESGSKGLQYWKYSVGLSKSELPEK